MIYRCSTEQAERSFQHIGLCLLDMLSVVLLMELHIHSTYKGQTLLSDSHGVAQQLPDLPRPYLQDSSRCDSIIKHVTRILSSFARSYTATTAIAKHDTLITRLESIIECSKGTISFESQNNVLWILANVACDKTNSVFLISANKRLLHTLTRVTSNPGAIVERKSTPRSHCFQALLLQRSALRCILNLSFVKGAADQLLAHSSTLLQSVCEIVTLSTEPFQRSAYVHDIVLQLKRYSVAILHNLSNTSDDNKLSLCHVQSGIVMKSLKEVATHDCDATVRRKATQTIANLVVFNKTNMGVRIS